MAFWQAYSTAWEPCRPCPPTETFLRGHRKSGALPGISPTLTSLGIAQTDTPDETTPLLL